MDPNLQPGGKDDLRAWLNGAASHLLRLSFEGQTWAQKHRVGMLGCSTKITPQSFTLAAADIAPFLLPSVECMAAMPDSWAEATQHTLPEHLGVQSETQNSSP